MKLKKIAVCGIIVLAVVVALCMFFSGTVRTITTPKIKQVAGRRGKLEERIEITAALNFEGAEEIGVELPQDATITITRVNTRQGYTCSSGDVLVEARVTGYEQSRKQYQDAYDEASEQLMLLESKNRSVRVSKRDEAYADAYYALRDARRRTVTGMTALKALLAKEKLPMTEEGYPEGASDALKAAFDEYRAAQAAQEAARDAWETASRYTVEEAVWTYITDKHSCDEKLAAAEAGLEALTALDSQVRQIVAPHNGYVAAVNVKEGDVCDGSQPLLAITPKGELPGLRADISQITRTVKEGMTVSMKVDSYNTIDTRVTAVGVDLEGKQYADIDLNKEMIARRGSVYAMAQEETPLTLVYRSKEATTLLPVSAVRGSGEDRYVFVVEKQDAAFGGTALKLRKVDVNVLAESDGTASVEEDLTYYSIAYMEDRPIAEGDTVMEYSD